LKRYLLIHVSVSNTKEGAKILKKNGKNKKKSVMPAGPALEETGK